MNRRKPNCFVSIQSHKYTKICGYSAVQRKKCTHFQQVSSLYFTNVPSDRLFYFSLCQL